MISPLPVIVLLALLLGGALGLGTHQSRSIVITNEVVNSIQKFWKNSGMCPPQPHQSDSTWLLSPSVQDNLRIISTLPNVGIERIRIHWLLDLVKCMGTGLTIQFDYSLLDAFVGKMHSYGLAIGFELMGNPCNFFTDFENGTQVYIWSGMVRSLVQRYMILYGKEYIRRWYFESWNEPDHKDFDSLNFTVQGFLNYFDACSEGVYKADPQLLFGGPAGACRFNKLSSLCTALLHHIATGKSYFNLTSETRVDFISFHKKGGRKSHGSTQDLINGDIAMGTTLSQVYPALRGRQLYNSESDPVVGWEKSLPFRQDSMYAAMAVKIIDKTMAIFKEKLWISNDNAFISESVSPFAQRTLLALFSYNSTNSPTALFVPKPIFNGLGLASLLGDMIVKVSGDIANGSDNGIIPTVSLTAREEYFAILVYNSADTDTSHAHNATYWDITLKVAHTSLYAVIQYCQNNSPLSNPFLEWVRAGSPPSPDGDTLEALWRCSHVKPCSPVSYHSNASAIGQRVSVPSPGLLLVMVCKYTPLAPGQPTAVVTLKRAVAERRFVAVYVLWKDGSVHQQCLLTYEVLVSHSYSGGYVKVNDHDFRFNWFAHHLPASHFREKSSPEEGVFYRVRAVNIWGTRGPLSEPAIWE